jgi:hypothetical protein
VRRYGHTGAISGCPKTKEEQGAMLAADASRTSSFFVATKLPDGLGCERLGAECRRRLHSIPHGFNVILPDLAFQEFEIRLKSEREKSQFTYGFPNSDGDCNCATWLERLALPLISGSMLEFANMAASSHYPGRRFGECIWEGEQ